MSDKSVSEMTDAEIRAMAGAELPADLMRRAASLLREYIAAASPANWQHMCLGSEGCQVLNDGHLHDRKHVARFGRKEWKADHADAVYVAAMGPQVGSPLAKWLEAEAERCATWTWTRVTDELAPALAVARAVLDGAR